MFIFKKKTHSEPDSDGAQIVRIITQEIKNIIITYLKGYNEKYIYTIYMVIIYIYNAHYIYM